MKKEKVTKNGTANKPVRESRFPSSLFVVFYLVLLLMSGVHMGLVVLVNRMEWNAVVQCIVPLAYWGMVAMALILFTKRKIRSAYEEPMHKMAEATKKSQKEIFLSMFLRFIQQISWIIWMS